MKVFLVLSLIFVSTLILFTSSVTARDEEVTEHAFAAEVSKMMDIIIHSLYKSKEIFLRELIANASDALDKLRQLGLTNKALMDDWQLNIKIRADPEKRTLTIRDSGVGMTKEELVTNLGTIARSGTKEFIEKFSEKNDSQQIGQFGVGFYSSFLAGDVVKVISKTFDSEKYLWKCNIKTGVFSVALCPESEDIDDPITTQGTKIIIHLNEVDEDSADYTVESVLKDLVHRYSEFINFPIYLLTRKTISSEVPLTESELEAANAVEEKNESEVKVEDAKDEKKAEKKTTKTVTKTTEEYVLVNDNKPIWTREPSEVSQEEYIQFYKNFTKDTKEPFDYSHFKVQGETTDFRGLVYIPKTPSFQLLSNDQPVDFLKVFVKRVFISSDFPDFPRYLSFVKALVDVDDIPLNVSRETLQKTKVVQNIKKSIIDKTLSLMNKMTENETNYLEFYATYANHLKLGVISEQKDSRKKDLAGLLRFSTSYKKEDAKSGKSMTSFDDYISRMKTNQTDIYFVSGSDINTLKRLPYVEALLKRDYEVLYMVDTYDEYTIQALPSYKDKTLKNVAKGGITFPADDTEEDKKKQEEIEARFKPLAEYLQKLFSKRIDKVVMSHLLDKSPMAIVANMFGFSPAMEKLMAGNVGGSADPMSKFFASQKKVMEINPNHPLMEGLLSRVIENATDKQFESDIRLLYDAALMHSGYELKNPASFAFRVEDMIREKYHVEPLSEASKKEALEAEETDDAGMGGMPDLSGMGGMPDMDSMGGMPNMDDFDFDSNPDFNTKSPTEDGDAASEPKGESTVEEKDEL